MYEKLKKIAITSAISLSVSFPSSAERIFNEGKWSVDVVKGSESTWCEAATRNQSGQRLDISAFSSGSLGLWIWDERWELAERPVNFLLDIDYSRWEITGKANGDAVSIFFNDAEKTLRFLKELMGGSAVAVYNSDEIRLGTFSLAGSSAALKNLLGCWNAITPDTPADPEDPFVTSADPFV